MRIHIIGGCGSGKTYIARRLSKELGISHYQTDNLVWDRSDPSNQVRFSKKIRDEQLCSIIEQDSWIVEGVHHQWVYSSLQKADYIFILEPNLYKQNMRVFKRFLKTRLGLEERNYTQDMKNLFTMIRWNREFKETNIVEIMEITACFKAKRHVVKNNIDILKRLRLMITKK